MKRPLIFVIPREQKSTTLSPIWPALELLGYQVQVFPPDTEIDSLAGEGPPDLIIMDCPLPEQSSHPRRQESADGHCRIGSRMILSEETGLRKASDREGPDSDFPFDLVLLQERIEKKLPPFPRKHIRMTTRLPCVFSFNEKNYFGEIKSLGTGGAFIRIAGYGLRAGDLFQLGVPLFGMKKELEIQSQVVYLLPPGPGEICSPGIGVTFLSPDPESVDAVQDFIRFSLLNEIAPFRAFPSLNQLSNQAPLRSTSASGATPRLYLKT